MDKVTTTIDIVSSVHGRERRELRDISKIDLSAAVKYGVKEEGWPDPNTGLPRWKYTFAGITFITDYSSTIEITSYSVPLPPIPLMKIPKKDVERHDVVKDMLIKQPELCTSHTVLVIDQSGSMKNGDVYGYRNRSKAVYSIMAKDFIKSPLDSGERNETDVVSLIEMHSDGEVIFQREPLDFVLFNKILRRRDDASPRSHGNYIPSLRLAEELLNLINVDTCPLVLLFVSDGKPSDFATSRIFGIAHDSENMKNMMLLPQIKRLTRLFGKRLTIGTLGFAKKDNDFAALKDMADLANLYGSNGTFQHCSLVDDSLSSSLTTLASSLTASRTQYSTLYEGTHVTPLHKGKRTMREAKKELSNEYVSDTTNWEFYNSDISRARWSKEKGKLEFNEELFDTAATGVAIRKCYFGEGAERIVYRAQEYNADKAKFVGRLLVAKESKYMIDEKNKKEKDFHEVFCMTQSRANTLAIKFNDRVERSLRNQDLKTIPRIQFLDCYVYVVNDPRRPDRKRGILVEKFIDASKYTKWNNNKGGVTYDATKSSFHVGREQHLDLCFAIESKNLNENEDILGVIEEEEDGESSDDDCDGSDYESCIASEDTEIVDESAARFEPWMFPQAFSHFTHVYKKRKLLVCDLQGVYNTSVSPPVFEMTDPVIHYRPKKDKKDGKVKKCKYGRTDLGAKGIWMFFQTHECNLLCKALRLPSNKKRE